MSGRNRPSLASRAPGRPESTVSLLHTRGISRSQLLSPTGRHRPKSATPWHRPGASVETEAPLLRNRTRLAEAIQTWRTALASSTEGDMPAPRRVAGRSRYSLVLCSEDPAVAVSSRLRGRDPGPKPLIPWLCSRDSDRSRFPGTPPSGPRAEASGPALRSGGSGRSRHSRSLRILSPGGRGRRACAPLGGRPKPSLPVRSAGRTDGRDRGSRAPLESVGRNRHSRVPRFRVRGPKPRFPCSARG